MDVWMVEMHGAVLIGEAESDGPRRELYNVGLVIQQRVQVGPNSIGVQSMVVGLGFNQGPVARLDLAEGLAGFRIAVTRENLGARPFRLTMMAYNEFKKHRAADAEEAPPPDIFLPTPADVARVRRNGGGA